MIRPLVAELDKEMQINVRDDDVEITETLTWVSPSEFVIPLAKYNKAVYGHQLSLGMRFRMMFETKESGTRRYIGTITGISDLDSVRWKNPQWCNLQVGWDESASGERHNRVSIWEIKPVAAPFFICPPPFFRTKRPRQPGMTEAPEWKRKHKAEKDELPSILLHKQFNT